MSAKALRPVCDSREQAAPWQPSNSALSGSDRHDFAVSQGLDIANWGLAKETPVLAIELARTFVANLERCTCRIQFTGEHPLPRGRQAKPLLKLKRSHESAARALGSAREIILVRLRRSSTTGVTSICGGNSKPLVAARA